MKNLKAFIESGILESYVMGNSTPREADLVEEMATMFKEVRDEMDAISEAFEFCALSHAITPGPVVKFFLMAMIDYSERIKNGEAPATPPELHAGSAIQDYAEWLNRPDLALPPDFNELHAKIIGHTPTATTAIVWISSMAPQEVHDNEHERFLIVEGTCNIIVGDEAHPLVPGDYFAIPLHKCHHVVVTSSIPCKVILQRIAA